MAAWMARMPLAGCGSSGSSSGFTSAPSRANGQPPKLWARNRRAPAARAADSRWSLPSVRSRFVVSK